MTDLACTSVLAAMVLVVLLVRPLRRRSVRRAIDRLAEKSGLALSEEVLPLLLRWRRATWIGYAVGVPVGFEAAAIAVSVARTDTTGIIGAMAPTASWLLAGGLGALIGALIGSRTVRPEGQRIARDRRVTIADYVDPIERRTAIAAGGLALIVGTASATRGASTGIAAGALGALAVGVTFALAHRTVAAPQRVASTVAMAWEDAVRATTARPLIQVGGCVALYSLMVSLPLLAVGRARTADLQLQVMLGVSLLALAAAIRSMLNGPARYFLRRLWPRTAAQLAADERPMEVQP